MQRRIRYPWSIAVGLLALAACAEQSADDSARSLEPDLSSGDGALTASIQVNSWGAGFCANVAVINTTSSNKSNWYVGIDLAGTTVTNLWSATLTGNGNQRVALPASYNTIIRSGGWVDFGFCGSGSGKPTLTSVGLQGQDAGSWPDAGSRPDGGPTPADAGHPADAGSVPDAGGRAWYAGVSLAGADFGEANLPGVYATDYIYPNADEVNYFVSKGLSIFRLPFRWERLQRSLNGELDGEEFKRLDGVVSYATAAGASVLLDPHNYARYHGNLIGSSQVPRSAFADFWRRLALKYRSNPRVLFGLMNEPNQMATEDWLSAANEAIAAIRGAGAANLVLVPGNAWTGAASWADSWYGTPNAEVLLRVVDPGNNYAYEVHQYLDSDSSGTSGTCVSPTIGAERVSKFTQWLRSNGRRGFLGEFAGADNATCKAAIGGMLDYLGANRDLWIGFTWWAAGPWWGDNMFSIEPKNGVDRPQLAWVLDHR